MFRAAQNATGTAIVIAIIVPKVAIFIVSQTGTSSSVIYDHLGGIMRLPISAACLGASWTKNHTVFSEITLHANRTIEIPTNHPSQIPICFFVVLLLHSMSFPLLITTITAPIFLNNLMHIPIPSR